MDKEEMTSLAKSFEDFDHPYRLDPFKKIHWGTIRDWQDDMATTIEVGKSWTCVVKDVSTRRKITDLSGEIIDWAIPGERECVAFAYKDKKIAEVAEFLVQQSKRLGLWITRVNMENSKSIALMAGIGAKFISSKVAGVGSDIYGTYYLGDRRVKTAGPKQRVCFARLGTFDARDIADRLLNSLEFAPTDRGVRYGGPKKTWRRVNIRLAGEKNDFEGHAVFKVAPELLKILSRVGRLSDIDYTMLTRVDASEGIIARHTDIALDTKSSRLGFNEDERIRFHFVLQSNPQCVFNIWNIDGAKHSLIMKTGEIWYTDVRKPHSVENKGGNVRVHLMVDFFCKRDYFKEFDKVIPQ